MKINFFESKIIIRSFEVLQLYVNDRENFYKNPENYIVEVIAELKIIPNYSIINYECQQGDKSHYCFLFIDNFIKVFSLPKFSKNECLYFDLFRIENISNEYRFFDKNDRFYKKPLELEFFNNDKILSIEGFDSEDNFFEIPFSRYGIKIPFCVSVSGFEKRNNQSQSRISPDGKGIR
jgi:hypothetical protein